MKAMSVVMCFFVILYMHTLAFGKTLFEVDFRNDQAGEQPSGWQDERQGLRPEATLVCDSENHGVIEIMNDGGWGSVQSLPLTMNPEQYNGLELEVERMDARSSLVLDLYAEDALNKKFFRCGRIYQPGLYIYDLKKVVPNTDVRAYGIQITLEGKKNMRAVLRRLRIFGVDNARLIDFPYVADFKHANGQRPDDWRGGHNNADIYCTHAGQAEITLGAEKDYGDVLSPVFAQTEAHPYERCVFEVSALTPEATMVAVLQEEREAARHFMLLDKISVPGRYQVEIGNVLRFHKVAQFSIKLWLTGKAKQSRAVLNDFEVLQSRLSTASAAILSGGPESSEQSITVGIERRVYEDFDNLQKIKLVSADLEKKLAAQGDLPVKCVTANERELLAAYRQGEVDMLVSYREFFMRCAQAGFLRPALTAQRGGQTGQVCGLYVRAGDPVSRLDSLHAAKVGVTSERAKNELEKYIGRTRPGMAFAHYFKQVIVLDNVRDALLELQLKKVDAIAEFEYSEAIAKNLGIELKRIAEMSRLENSALYVRTSRNVKKNSQMERMLRFLEGADTASEYAPFFERFGIERLIRVPERH